MGICTLITFIQSSIQLLTVWWLSPRHHRYPGYCFSRYPAGCYQSHATGGVWAWPTGWRAGCHCPSVAVLRRCEGARQTGGGGFSGDQCWGVSCRNHWSLGWVCLLWGPEDPVRENYKNMAGKVLMDYFEPLNNRVISFSKCDFIF